MLRNPTYEVLKMKVLMMRNDHRGFHERTRGLACAIARQKLKNSKMWQIKLRIGCQNFEVFNHLRAIACDMP